MDIGDAWDMTELECRLRFWRDKAEELQRRLDRIGENCIKHCRNFECGTCYDLSGFEPKEKD